jgi:hypothetical protein
MHQRHDRQTEQHRDQETDRQIHDRLDHGTSTPATLTLFVNNATARGVKASPKKAPCTIERD